MLEFKQFVRSVWKHLVHMLTSGAAAALVTVWDHVRVQTIGKSVLFAMTMLFLLQAFYKSWRDEYLKRIRVASELSDMRLALETERAKKTLQDSEARLAEARIDEISAQKRKREADERHTERMRFLTAPDSGIRYYVQQLKGMRRLSTMAFAVEHVAEGLSVTHEEIEEALLLLKSRLRPFPPAWSVLFSAVSTWGLELRLIRE